MKAEKYLPRKSNTVELAPKLRLSFFLKRISPNFNIQDLDKMSYSHTSGTLRVLQVQLIMPIH